MLSCFYSHQTFDFKLELYAVTFLSYILHSMLCLAVFEALCCGSWKGVELLRISNGTMNMKFIDHPCVIQDKGPFANLRIKSRRATLYDCICLLRPGVDICVLSNSDHTESSDKERRDPVSGSLISNISNSYMTSYQSKLTIITIITSEEDQRRKEKNSLAKPYNSWV